MPSYIEIDKQGTFPASSNVGKVILGVNTNNNIVITDVSGNTTQAGGGSGIIIPTPVPYSEIKSPYVNFHVKNASLPTGPLNGWIPEMLCLTYQSNETEFLNYNPRYFLYLYRNRVSTKQFNDNNEIIRTNKKFNFSFVHPASFTVNWETSGITSTGAYRNFSTGSIEEIAHFPIGYNEFTTEWDVPTGIGKQTILTGFNPSRFFTNNFKQRGLDFFPFSYDDRFQYSTTTVKSPKRYPQNATVPRYNLYFRFAIVIDDPKNPNRYIVGPFSETVKICPLMGYFNDGNPNQKYYYAWSVRRA